jgi:hypothetical protein
MNSVCLIDEKLFHRYLLLNDNLTLPSNTRRMFAPALVLWNEAEDLRDLRRLALGMSELLDLNADGVPKNTLRKLPTNEQLNELFRSPAEEDLDKVARTTEKTASTKAGFANLFYSALIQISPLNLAQVLDEERKRIGKPIKRSPAPTDGSSGAAGNGGSVSQTLPDAASGDPTALQSVLEEMHLSRHAALCFSGGGIRSATFGLGIIQSLSKHSLLQKFDYLSTVSGGGYLGSWLSAWISREHENRTTDTDRDHGVRTVEKAMSTRTAADLDDPNPEPPQLQHLREYSNYMRPKRGLLSADTWTLAAIYLRNLLLNLLIFVPLITALLMLPRFLFRAFIYRNAPPTVDSLLLIVAGLAGSFAIGFVISSLPSKRVVKDEVEPQKEGAGKFNTFLNTDPGVLIFGVMPLVTTAFLASVLWMWHATSRTRLDPFGVFRMEMPEWIGNDLGLFLFVTSIAYLFGLGFFILVSYLIRGRLPDRDFKGAAAALASSLIGGFLLWLAATRLFPFLWTSFLTNFGGGYIAQFYVAVAIPFFLLIVLISASIYVGLTSRPATDEDREWLARYGAWVLIICGVWFVFNLLVLIGPSVWEWLFRFHWTDLFTEGLPAALSSAVAVISGAIALVGGFSGRSLVRDEPKKSRSSLALAYLPRVASVVFLLAILVGLAYLATALFYAIGSASAMDHVSTLRQVHFVWLVVLFVALGAIGFAMACFVNVNKFSLHGAYRDRLVRAYLGASHRDRKQNTFTGFDDKDNLELHKLEHQRPLYVINATVNLVGGKNLAWQDRKAASFTMSPLHCGSWAVNGYRKSKEYCRSNTPPKRALRLGTAMAISGAAANPNMGYYSSSIVTFLMSLFNIRLGWWLGNTGEPGSAYHWWNRGNHRFFEKVGPSIAVLPLLNETLGRTDETKKFLMVTDGGHFENLALYEMVLRRCKLIVLSDGAADADFKFGEIANAIQKCKVDLGADIEFVGSMNIRPRSKEKEDEKLTRSRFAIARIKYPETHMVRVRNKDTGKYEDLRKRRTGWLLYTRPTFYRNEPRDILNYAESNDKFPHQSTGDQMYDEKQFEAYRGLGYVTMEEIRRIFDATAKGDPEHMVDDELEALFDGEEDMRETLFTFFNVRDPKDPKDFKTRAKKRNTFPVPPFPVG